MIGGGRPLLLEILGQTDRVGAKSPTHYKLHDDDDDDNVLTSSSSSSSSLW